MKSNKDYMRSIVRIAMSGRNADDLRLYIALAAPTLRGVSNERQCAIVNELFYMLFEETGTTHGTELIQWLDDPARGALDFRKAVQKVLDRLES